MIGPTLTITKSCSACECERSESYTAQGDSGMNVYCEHPAITKRRIGSDNWRTPDWCPALHSQQAAHAWQPIETAPKDGTKILICRSGENESGEDLGVWWACSGFWSAKWKNWNDGTEPSGLYRPTHWMPLPAVSGKATQPSQQAAVPDFLQHLHDWLLRVKCVSSRDDGTAERYATQLRAMLAAAPQPNQQTAVPDLGVVPVAAYDRLHSLVESQAKRIMALEFAPQPIQPSDDAARLNEIASEYYGLEPFDRPTGGDDADVGWRVLQWHMGEKGPRTVAEVYEDNPRAAIDAAMQKGGA